MWPDYTITGGPPGQQSGHLASKKKSQEEDQEQDEGTTSYTTWVSPGSGWLKTDTDGSSPGRGSSFERN